jgi:beta-glucanase (GH16 family)
VPSPAARSGTLNAIATGNPTPLGAAAGVLPSGSLGEFISGLLQLTRRWFFNSTPTAAVQHALTRPNGQTWGFLTARDADGEQIDYAVTRNAKFGTVSVTPSGVYIYTPGAGFTGTDSFTLTLTNPGFHINLLNPFDSQRREVTVTVDASNSGTVADDFGGVAGSAPDPALWGYHLGPYRDHGLQTYTDSPDNVRLDGQGHLVIQARDTGDGYTSTRLVTQDKLAMQYGSIQARIKMPSGQGIWPAFWTLGTSYYPDEWLRWPACGEIDIMELVNNGSTYNVALHGPQGSTDYYGGAAASGQFVGTRGPISEVSSITDLTDDFHDYWTIWREDHIVVGVDGTMLAEFTPASLPAGGQWVFNAPMYAILQIAVGGDWPGPPDESTPWPATMLVDSFRYTPLR